MPDTQESASPAIPVDQIGMSPAEKRRKEEEKAERERGLKDGPVEGELVELPDGSKITTAEAIERANAEAGGFIGKAGKPTEEQLESEDEIVEPTEVEEPEEQIEDLPDTQEKLRALVAELIGLKTENSDLRRKFAGAVTKVSQLERERDAANAEVQAYYERHGALSTD